jgi:hypothetical protein
MNNSDQFEVLSPWAEIDPITLNSLAPRLESPDGKRIGLFVMKYKHASALVQTVIEKRLKERYPSAKFFRFDRHRGADFDSTLDNYQVDPVQDKRELADFEDWLKGLDAVIGAVGD